MTKYINRYGRNISHVFHSESNQFNTPACDPTLGIWKNHFSFGRSTVTDQPELPMCKRCEKLRQEAGREAGNAAP
jgi:hypothetical protein